MNESRTRKVTMTVYKIEAQLLDVSSGQGPEYLPCYVTVHAQGGGDFHSWMLGNDERVWIGDTVEVSIIEPAPTHPTSTPLKVPPKDTR